MIASDIRNILRVSVLGAVAALSLLGFTQSGTGPAGAKPRARVAFSHSLPKLDGDRLKTTVLEVSYGPGESSMPHTHPCAVIGYVTQGSIRTQVKGQLATTVRTGESFYEAPNAVHLIAANASRTESAGFLAFFVCDHDALFSSDVSSAFTQGRRNH